MDFISTLISILDKKDSTHGEDEVKHDKAKDIKALTINKSALAMLSPLLRNNQLLTDHTSVKVIVVFKPSLAGSPQEACNKIKNQMDDIPTDYIYHSSIKAFASRLNETRLKFLIQQPDILRIERDHILSHCMFASFINYLERNTPAIGDKNNNNNNKINNNKINNKIDIHHAAKTNSSDLSSTSISSSSSTDDKKKKKKNLNNNNKKDKSKSRLKPNPNYNPNHNFNNDSADDDNNKQWNLNIVRPPIDYRHYNNSGGVNMLPVHIFIFDTGISTNHPDLPVKPENRRNFVINDIEDEDLQGHSSHVAGIAGAVAASTNSGTKRGVTGVSPGVQLHSFKVLDKNGNGNMSYTLAGVEFLTQEKLRFPHVPMIANLSLGFHCGGPEYNVLDEAIDRAIQVGVVFVLAAGNEGKQVSSFSPAHVERAIVVGACSKSGEFAKFSNRGPGLDIIAPGVDIYSTWKAKGYKRESGTSMATPHVSSAAALYLCCNPMATPDQVKYFLLNCAQRGKLSNLPSNTPNLLLWIPQEIIGRIYR